MIMIRQQRQRSACLSKFVYGSPNQIHNKLLTNFSLSKRSKNWEQGFWIIWRIYCRIFSSGVTIKWLPNCYNNYYLWNKLKKYSSILSEWYRFDMITLLDTKIHANVHSYNTSTWGCLNSNLSKQFPSSPRYRSRVEITRNNLQFF